MHPGAIRSAVHAATRCAFAITTLHPGSNLKNLAYEEGKKRGSLQPTPVKRTSGKRNPYVYGDLWLDSGESGPRNANDRVGVSS